MMGKIISLLFLTGALGCAIDRAVADEPSPDPGKRCSLATIHRPPVSAQLELVAGVKSDILLERTVSLARVRASDGTRGIRFSESGAISLPEGVLGKTMQLIADGIKARTPELCQVTVSTWLGSASWAQPPTYEFYGDGKGRKCTSFDYPCGQEFKCEIRWNYQKCQTWTKWCTSTQKFDIGNWWLRSRGHLPVGVSADGRAITLSAVADSFEHDETGAGEIAGILDRWGVLALIQKWDTGFGSSVNPDQLPSVAQLVKVLPPNDFIQPPKLTDASWKPSRSTQGGKYSSIGISYHLNAQLKEATGCRVARCMRNSTTDDEYLKCVFEK